MDLYPSEAALLEAFIGAVRWLDPDIIVGYEASGTRGSVLSCGCRHSLHGGTHAIHPLFCNITSHASLPCSTVTMAC